MLGLLCLAALAAGCGPQPSSRGSHGSGAPADRHAAPPPTQSASADVRGYTGELPPLPTPPFAAARPAEIVRAVYAFAARHPEVLRYVPCFCGCETRGHRDNEDCFVSGRDADGRPHWEAHGMG